ncbi:MAG: TonB-dependent receptor [Bacteroidota bacterium]
MRYLLLISSLILVAFSSHAQTTITGTVQDSSGISLPGANVVLLNASDSLLAGFAVTDKQGQFQLSQVKPGQYLLRCTFLGYQQREQTIKVETSDQLLGLGKLVMYPEGYFLDGIEVNGYRIPIRMRGDTMVFDADAFASGPNAVVEDLLRRLPGMQIRGDGAILFQGKPVSEVMVNGKPFFRGNSQIVTQNLDAAAIENVEVFDQKTDAETVSGLDDGREDITVNLEMKEEAKNQLFGKLNVGGGTNNRYRAGGNVFQIGDRSQLGGVGLWNNTNQVGFSPETALGFSSGGVGGIRIRGDDAGLPVDFGDGASGDNRSFSTGLNYGTSIGKRGNFTASYVVQDRRQEVDEHLLDVYTGELLGRINELTTAENNRSYAHRLDVEYELAADTSSNLTFTTEAALAGQRDRQDAATLILAPNEADLEYEQNENNRQRTPSLTSTLRYNRRLGQRGKTLDFQQAIAFSNTQTDLSTFIAGLNPLSEENSLLLQNGQQDQIRHQRNRNINGTLGYNHPISNSLTWRNEVRLEWERNRANFQLTFDSEETASSGLTTNIENRQFLTSLRKQWQDSYLALGGRAFWLDWRISEGFSRREQQVWLAPEITWSLTKNRSRLLLAITGRPQLPQSDQLQVFVDPRDVSTYRVGNPNLNAGFVYQLVSNYFIFDQFTGFSANFAASVGYFDQPIRNELKLVEGRQLSRPVNLSHAWQRRFSGGIRQDLNFIDSRLGANISLAFVDGPGRFNGETQQQTTADYQAELNVTKEINPSSFAEFGYRIQYNRNRFSSINDEVLTSLTGSFTASLQIEVSPKWRLENDFSYRDFRAGDLGQSTQIPIWNARLEIRPFRKAPHYFTISGSDLLNQNLQIDRTTQTFFTRERQTNGIGRIWLLSFYWKI